jgi:7-carboxy-7-deazaguanine synthase
MSLRVIEVYASYQGEGPNTSRPTVFVRFAGCNFKCPLWPCDTQHAIDPKLFRTTQRFLEPQELVDEVVAFGIDNICLTGGEVFLQQEDALADFLLRLDVQTSYKWNVECFTNGSLPWGRDAVPHINNFILDWKLPGSGEAGNYAENPAWEDNLARMTGYDAIKFTIADRVDYEMAKRRYWAEAFDKQDYKVYAGVVWGKLETEELCKWMIEDKLPWYLNVQVHKFVWHPDQIGV